jgi:hypothetical protein
MPSMLRMRAVTLVAPVSRPTTQVEKSYVSVCSRLALSSHNTIHKNRLIYTMPLHHCIALAGIGTLRLPQEHTLTRSSHNLDSYEVMSILRLVWCCVPRHGVRPVTACVA